MNEFRSTSDFKQSGFTLLEILIAITLLAFISLGVVNITENAVLTMERTTEANTNNLQIETAMSRFEWDFSQIYSPLYFSSVMKLNSQQNIGNQTGNETEENREQNNQTFNPVLQQYYEQLVQRFERNEHFSSVSKEGYPIPRFYAPEKNVFEFFTSSNRRKLENQRQSHFAWVRYSLAEQDQTTEESENPNIPKSLKSLVRYFTADDPYGDKRINIENTDRVKGAVLLRNVESLEFQYWDYQRRKWETSLRSIQGGENLIRGVRVLITWYDLSGHKRSTSRIFRNNWPMVTPQDDQMNNTRTTGTTNGTTTGGTNGTDGQVRDEE
jgi:prepilin-type N-terminal cleavage/methylation domain-containing protein